jgi:phospholipid/cholesterol/gamma-HCH transport system ATP-binding protein
MMKNDIVQVRNLTSGYQDVAILEEVSMSAREGQITVILGSSGCGKTTLLKHLIRLYLPWSGTIRLFDQDITRMDETAFNHLLRKVGVLFQNGALLNSLSVSENVAIPLEQHTDLPAEIIKRLINVKLELVELGYAADRLPSELSGGMRKRAALARALALDPPLLFCDEPSAGLDPITTASLDSLILKLRDWLGISVVMVSHDIASIMRVADHVVFLDKGRLLFEGPLSDVHHAGIEKIDEFFSKR